LENPGVEYCKRLGLTLHGNLCGILGPISSEGLSEEFCGSCHFSTALNNADKALFFKPASSHLVGILAGQIDPFPDLNIYKKKQTQKQDPTYTHAPQEMNLGVSQKTEILLNHIFNKDTV
jgi:hypothetical protein